MKIRLVFILLLMGIFYSTICTAQKYRSAAGIRMDGKMIGLTYSQRFFKRTTAELNLDFRQREIKTTGMAKLHKPLVGRGLTLFAGLGYHLGSYKDLGGFSGGDISVGAEHKIIILPISISFEINPSIHLTGEHPDWYTFQSSFTLKYILVKSRRKLFNRNN